MFPQPGMGRASDTPKSVLSGAGWGVPPSARGLSLQLKPRHHRPMIRPRPILPLPRLVLIDDSSISPVVTVLTASTNRRETSTWSMSSPRPRYTREKRWFSGISGARFHSRCPSPLSGWSKPPVPISEPGGPCSSCVVAASGSSLRSPTTNTARCCPSPASSLVTYAELPQTSAAAGSAHTPQTAPARLHPSD